MPNLRSNYNSSGSTSSTPASIQEQPSNNDIMNVVTELKAFQAQVLSSISNISKLQSSQFSDLKNDFHNVSKLLHSLQADNTFRKEQSSLKERVDLLKLKYNELGPISTPPLIPDLIQELAKREKCTLNVIVHNLLESSSTVSSERIAFYSKSLTDILSPLFISLPLSIKLVRIGPLQPNCPRPLKVLLNTREEVLNILSTFNSAKRSRPSVTIAISRDRTLMER